MVSTQLARAKINLTLRVLGRRADGYHEIESLVTFAAVADRLSWHATEAAGVVARGPFAASIEGRNILELAIELLRQHGLIVPLIELEKNLPVAAGLGGGSSDAGALLRLARLGSLARDVPGQAALAQTALAKEGPWGELARRLGADVPVCFADRPAVIAGIGDEVRALPRKGLPLPAVLANPRLPLATGRVFAALAAQPLDRARASESAYARLVSPVALCDHMRAVGNDLERPAMLLLPVIAEVKAALLAQPGCRAAAMSGSGPTCFAIFDAAEEAAAAASALRRSRPGWWIVATELEGVTAAG
jgi:4-diphosphocytidyl-2-C-methyl-D-erythritol kinase